MQHCDSTCTHCAREFWAWWKSRAFCQGRLLPNARSGPGIFDFEAAKSVWGSSSETPVTTKYARILCAQRWKGRAMRTVVQTVEVDGEGLEALLDQYVVIWCCNYIYSGKLVGINDTCIKLLEPYMVFETGQFSADSFKDAQKLPSDYHYVNTSGIESYCARGF